MQNDTEEPRGQDPDETEEGSPVPDPVEGERGDAEDVPEAD